MASRCRSPDSTGWRIADLRRESADGVSAASIVPPALACAYHFTPGQYVTLRAWIDGVEVRRALAWNWTS